MKFQRVVACAVVAGATLAPVAASADGGRSQSSTIKVGAASRTVLPTVDGSHRYLRKVRPDLEDAFSPGLFVAEWDQGRVAVGNGASASHWVHDDMEVSAVAFQEIGQRDITVMVAANLYMIFGSDGDVIRQRVADKIGPERASRLQIAISADHNHHGPDTAFDVNHEWYDLMVEQASDAIVEAVDELRPARLEVGQTEHYFGLDDGRDPQVFDPTLGVLRATSARNGRTIATLLFWANHPETTLFWEPPNGAAEDAYFTADFPGWATRILEGKYGGEALYFNGAIGDLVTPLGSNVWEVNDDAPLGNGLVPPPGAQPPFGATSFQERNFRRAYLIGRELAEAAIRALNTAEAVDDPTVEYEVQPVYTRMSNIGFRLLLVRGADGLTQLGHTPAMLYNCPATGPKDDTTCVPDGFATESDPLLGDIRAGDHARTRVAYLRIGPVGTMWIPAEIGPESTIGLPSGYSASPATWHELALSLHANGADYVTSGYVKNRMDDEYRWIVGLGNDELGYAVPLADYRVRCVADEIAGPGTCAALHAAGVIEYPDSIAGATCKAITEDPSLLGAYGPAAEAVAGSCRYGQAFGEADDHYEETNSAGWDLEADLLAAVAALSGSNDPTRENPSFPGWWTGHLPN
jgi:hypothetical protein